MKFPRNARIFRGQLDASPFVGVLFLVAIFLLLNSSLVFVPGVAIKLPEAADLPGVIGPTFTVVVDSNRHFYFRSQIIKEGDFRLNCARPLSKPRNGGRSCWWPTKPFPLIRWSSWQSWRVRQD